jgi:hypothetical protein
LLAWLLCWSSCFPRKPHRENFFGATAEKGNLRTLVARGTRQMVKASANRIENVCVALITEAWSPVCALPRTARFVVLGTHFGDAGRRCKRRQHHQKRPVRGRSTRAKWSLT